MEPTDTPIIQFCRLSLWRIGSRWTGKSLMRRMWSSGAEGTETLGCWSGNVLNSTLSLANLPLVYFGNISDDTRAGHGVDQGDPGPKAEGESDGEESMMNLLGFNHHHRCI
ncbi:hypothetical protein NHX12_026801 [Muraenolepis orangiensis]|uniref:Uncharacterized protein n=1 Tax=Muraenolepis orangiensis TaxID=630683 RepID=A0A9Q0I0C8_9TELE|nr:hypothetical protein NHX12_026801 [Muraenolepis orangiensis]